MTDRERDLKAICQRLGQEKLELRLEVEELTRANAELRVERDATDLALGEAMSIVLGRRL
jgi:hypothetical protein